MTDPRGPAWPGLHRELCIAAQATELTTKPEFENGKY